MPGTNAFRDYVAAGVASGTLTPYNNANSSIGVGDSSAAFAATQTDLQAATNKLRKAMDATFPTLATNVLTFRATFGTSEANWAWNEWATFNTTSASGGTMLQRKVESLGTKTSAQTWQITATITLGIS